MVSPELSFDEHGRPTRHQAGYTSLDSHAGKNGGPVTLITNKQ